MKKIHQALDFLDDNFNIRTFHVERLVRIFFEGSLLTMCALPVIVDWKSGMVQLVLGLLRLGQAEVGRERSSIKGRAEEVGLIVSLPLAPEKEERLLQLSLWDMFFTWIWAVVGPFVAAMTAGQDVSLVLILGVLATILRSLYDRNWVPDWRKSRLEWKIIRRS